MQPDTKSIPQTLALRKDQIRAGFSVNFAECEDCIIVRRNGRLFQRYGQRTPMDTIHRDIDNCIESIKALGQNPYRSELDRFLKNVCPGDKWDSCRPCPAGGPSRTGGGLECYHPERPEEVEP